MNLTDTQVPERIPGIDPTILVFGNDTVPLSDARKVGFLRFWRNGTRLDVHAPACEGYVQYATAGVKKTIAGFSKKSRLTCIKRISTFYRRAEFRLITLTYQENVTDKDRYKRDLHAFLQRLRIDYPHVAGLWKLEFQERGAAHFHILVFGGWIDHRWIAATWDRIVGHEFGDEHSPSTSIEYPRDQSNVRGYTSKKFKWYASKEYDEEHGSEYPTGRIWGIHNGSGMPFVSPDEFLASADYVRRILDFWSERFGIPYRLNSVTIFLTDAQAVWLESILKPPP